MEIKIIKTEVYDFGELLGNDLYYLGLASILTLFGGYLEACKLPKAERDIEIKRIKGIAIVGDE